MLTDLIEIHFIEMPKFRGHKEKDIKNNPLHRWLKFFDKTLKEEELKELIELDDTIKRAEEKLEHLSSDEKAMALYRAREDSMHERANMINGAIAEGRKEGIKEGEKIKATDIAKKLMDIGLKIEDIVEATGLSEEEIRKLKI